MFAHASPSARRLLYLAGLVGPAVLGITAAPAAAQNITPERALLNSVPGSYAVRFTVEGQPIDGERALLGHSLPAASYELPLATQWQDEAPAIDGERALRGVAAKNSPRRLTLAQ